MLYDLRRAGTSSALNLCVLGDIRESRNLASLRTLSRGPARSGVRVPYLVLEANPGHDLPRKFLEETGDPCLSFDVASQDARPLDGDDGSDEDDDGPVAPNWEPVSRDADPSSGSRGGGDILSILVSIYGSKASNLGDWYEALMHILVLCVLHQSREGVSNRLILLKFLYHASRVSLPSSYIVAPNLFCTSLCLSSRLAVPMPRV